MSVNIGTAERLQVIEAIFIDLRENDNMSGQEVINAAALVAVNAVSQAVELVRLREVERPDLEFQLRLEAMLDGIRDVILSHRGLPPLGQDA